MSPLKDPKRANLTFYGTLNEHLLNGRGEHMYENYLKNLQKALKLIETPDIEVDELHPKMLDIRDPKFNVRSSIAILESIPGVDLG